MTEKLKKIVLHKDNPFLPIFNWMVKRREIFIRVTMEMEEKDPRANNIGVLMILSGVITLTQVLLGIVSVLGNIFYTLMLIIFLIIEFTIGFLFAYQKSKSCTYSVLVNFPGLKWIILFWTYVKAQVKNYEKNHN